MSEYIQIGDRFRVDIEVWHIATNGTYGCMFKRDDGARENHYLPAIVLRTAERLPRPIKVGDKVRHRDGDDGKVLAVDGDHAWVLMGGEYHITMSISALTLADEAAP